MQQSQFEEIVTKYQKEVAHFLSLYPTKKLQDAANHYPAFRLQYESIAFDATNLLTQTQFAWICDNLTLYHLALEENDCNYALLKKQTKLKSLSICYSDLSDISWVAALPNLVSLELMNTNVTNLNGLEYCKKITTLTLCNNHINNISPISGCNNLTHLNLLGNNIKDISPLSNLVHLTKLNITLQSLSWLDTLKTLPNLQYLNTSYCNGFSVALFSDFLALEELILRSSNLDNSSNFASIPNLIHLDITNNKFTKLPPLPHKLKSIDISHNRITDISPLADLDYLDNVLLFNNPITSPPPPSLLKAICSHNKPFSYPYGQPNKAIPPNAQQIWTLLISKDPNNHELAAQFMTALHWEQADADAYLRMAKEIRPY